MKTMRSIAAMAAVLLMFAGFTTETKAQTPSSEKVVTIEAAMSCIGCKNTIEAGLAKETGVQSVVADLKTKKVTVTYDESKTNDGNLVKSIEKMGYKAKVAEGKEKKAGEASRKTGGGC